jgi:acid phosphatase
MMKRFGLRKLIGIALFIWACLFLFQIDLPAAGAGEHADTTAIAKKKAKAQARDEERKKKKNKKKASDDDDDDDDSDHARVNAARPTPPFLIPPAVAGKRYAYFIAIGDWGTGSSTQRHVAGLMDAKASRDSLHFVLLLGDNFYSSGVTSVDDPQWQSKFETVYNLPALNVPFFAALGNHDYKKNANPNAQVNYAKGRSTKWTMPARYYTFTRALGAGTAIQFFALDTEALNKIDIMGTAQVEWLDAELAKSTATWKVAFGHHPVFSNGEHGDTPAMQKYIRPLLEKYRVDFYLAGHDHDRQLLQPVAGVNYIVSGTAAKSRDTRWFNNTIFAATDLGFTWFRVSAEEFHVQFINKKGEIEFAHTSNKTAQKSGGNAANR